MFCFLQQRKTDNIGLGLLAERASSAWRNLVRIILFTKSNAFW
ncbi:MAG: hypothetical protein K0R59_1535 [Sphingobacterium sp.]|jgi:hypothetical protein|nr:hypothetical protein [Sphingobacterium sp.]